MGEPQNKSWDSDQAFLQKDYELKITYLTNHLTRMWTRFNFFVTIESALIRGKFLFQGTNVTIPFIVAGAVISVLWYIMGAQDSYLVRIYRDIHVKGAANELITRIGTGEERYQYVGQVDWLKTKPKQDPLSWRIYWFSTTRQVSGIPLIILVLWLILSVIEWKYPTLL